MKQAFVNGDDDFRATLADRESGREEGVDGRSRVHPFELPIVNFLIQSTPPVLAFCHKRRQDCAHLANGWERTKAAELMRENILESDTQIYTETLRYSVDMPGQALGYRMGYLRISELREKAKQALGDKFDIRRFHTAVLESGSMPMTVLEKHIDGYIEKEQEQD